MVQDNRLVQEFQENTLVFDIGSVGNQPPTGEVSLSGIYGGIMPYRQSPTGGLTDALANVSGVGVPGEADSVNKHPINRVCVFENELHSVAQGQWWKQGVDGGAWSLVGTFEDAHSSYQNIGLYPVFNEVTNERYIVSAYAAGFSGRDWKGVKYNPITKVLETGLELTSATNSNTALSPSECQLGNRIYFAGYNEASTSLVLDMNTLRLYQLPFTDVVAGGVHRPVDFCAYSGQMYMAHKDTVGSSGIVTISKVDATARTLLQLPFEGYAGVASSDGQDRSRQRCLLFVDNNPVTASGEVPAMWLFYQVTPVINPLGGGNVGVEGYSVWKLEGDGNGGLTVINQKDEMMNIYRAGLGEDQIPVGNSVQAVLAYCDNYPGWFTSTPEKSFLTMRPFGGEPGQTFLQWDFDPEGSLVLGGGSIGGPAKVSFSQDKMGGGARWSPAISSPITGNDVNIFDIVYSSGHLVGTGPVYDTWRIHFELMPSHGYPAGTPCSVRWYHDRYHAPNKRCVISGASSHGTVSDNQITGLTMSSGVDYWVDWKFSDQNLVRGNKINLCGLVYVSGADIPISGL